MNKWTGEGGVGALNPAYRPEGGNYPHPNYSHQLHPSYHLSNSSSKSNSYHGDPYVPADVFNVSFFVAWICFSFNNILQLYVDITLS